MAAEPHGAQAAQQSIEHISHGDQCLAMIIRTNFVPQKTTFLTPSDYKQQIGFIVYPAGGEVPRHVHRPLPRQLVGTSEVLLVRQGHCVADIYNDEQELIAALSNVVMEVYAMESLLLRAQKAAAAKGEPAAKVMIDAARVFISDAMERVEHEAKRAIAAVNEGDMLTTQLAVLRRVGGGPT
jgi:hypothetical protein